MNDRLTTAVFTSAIVRGASARGGFAAILKKGDPDAGATLVIIREKGRIAGLYEPQLAADGGYAWTRVGPQDLENMGEIDDFLARRQKRDADIWVIELDIADGERFIAQYPRQA
jgi:hypothetical protein